MTHKNRDMSEILDKLIIKYYEKNGYRLKFQEFRDTDKISKFLVKSFSIRIFAMSVMPFVFYKIDILDLVSFLGVLVINLIISVYRQEESLTFMLLHKYLPGEEERHREINEFLELNPPSLDDRSVSFLNEQVALVFNQIIENKNIPQSIKRFLRERIKKEDGEINSFLLVVLQTIPINSLSINTLRDVVLSCINMSSPDERNVKKIVLQLNKLKEDISVVIFKDKTENEIKNILTRPYSVGEYLMVVERIIINREEIDITAKKLRDMIKNKKEVMFKYDGIDNNELEIKFRILRTYSEYSQTKESFKNCILTYFTDKSYDVLVAYKDGKEIACVSVFRNGSVSQIKGPMNSDFIDYPGGASAMKKYITKNIISNL